MKKMAAGNCDKQKQQRKDEQTSGQTSGKRHPWRWRQNGSGDSTRRENTNQQRFGQSQPSSSALRANYRHDSSPLNDFTRRNNESRASQQPKLGFRWLIGILTKEADSAIVELSLCKADFIDLVSQENIRKDLLILLVQVIGEKLCSRDANVDSIRNTLLVKVCTEQFFSQLKRMVQDFLEIDCTQRDNGTEIDKSPSKIFSNLLTFYQLVTKIMPTTAGDYLQPNIRTAIAVLKYLRAESDNENTTKLLIDLEAEYVKLELTLHEHRREKTQAETVSLQTRPSRKTGMTASETEKLYLENPPEDFKTLTVTPQQFELRSDENPFLRPNIIKGKFPSADVYLDVQFRLLREDFMEPLRSAIKDYLKNRNDYVSKRKKMPFGSVRIYNDVSIGTVKLDGDMTVYSLRFDMTQFRKIQWEKSKRLLPGSLLCLTSDNFQSLYLATIVFRKTEDLKRGNVDVVWEGQRPIISKDKSYLMMECEVYYEAYRHTLKTLQQIELDEYPMKKYIVDASTDDVPPPKFLACQEHLLDFSLMLKHKDKSSVRRLQQKMADHYDSERPTVETTDTIVSGSEAEVAHVTPLTMEISALNIKRWPTAIALGMDDSQFNAFQCAVTKEMSVIQGPPGTGKTYIGLQVVKLFLSNPHIYKNDSPILVVCYTNHALDQFLEGIVEVMNELKIDSEEYLIRIGSRSKSEELQKYAIHTRVRESLKNRKFSKNHAAALRAAKRELEDRQEERAELMDELKGLKNLNGVVDFSKLSIRYELIGRCPESLRSAIFGRVNVLEKQRPPLMYIPQNIVEWLGLKDAVFNNVRNFHPDQVMKTWSLKTSYGSSGPNNFLKTTPKNQNEEKENENGTENGDFVEGEYEMDDLMAHRIEIYREIETVRKRVNKRICYALSEWSINFHFLNIRKNIERLTAAYEEEKKLNHDLEILQWQIEWEYSKGAEQPFLSNKQCFLGYLLKAFAEGRLELPKVNETFLDRNNIAQNAHFNERWGIYFYFVEEAKKILLSKIENVEQRVMAAQKHLQTVNEVGEGILLRKSMIVGVTTTGAAKYNRLLRMMRSRIVIVEEAAEVQESHIVTSITKYCEQMILIGDHKQLRPSTTVYKLAKDYNLDVSLFERMINNDISSWQLRVQHRMRPSIAKLLVPTIYEDLENHPIVSDYPAVRGVTRNLFFITHNEHEKMEDDSASRSNAYEAAFLVKLCRHFILQGYKSSQITIITTYLGQMFLLKKMNSSEGVRITVVDNYQGEENDIILLSLVRSNPENNIGFLKTDNRICVAISRTKHGMFIIGNMDSLAGSGSSTWKKIKTDLEEDLNIGSNLELKCEVHGDITLIEKIEDFQNVPEGGCIQMCKKLLDCAHSCQSVCHAYDREHKEYSCRFPCNKKCVNDHPCKKQCYLECGACTVKMDKTLPCGHVVNIECNLPTSSWGCMITVEKEVPHCGHKKTMNCKDDPAKIICMVEIEKELPCEHKQITNCHQKVEDVRCNTILKKIMPKCEHEVQIKCSQKDDIESWQCRRMCDSRLKCGHTCGTKCHSSKDPDHLMHICRKPCGRSCPFDHKCADVNNKHQCHATCPPCIMRKPRILPCGHTQKIMCHLDVKEVQCMAICRNKLHCGHECSLKCHEKCLCKVLVKKASMDCEHEIELFCHQTPSREHCKVMVDAKVKSACGHPVFVPCKIQNTVTPTECLKYCKHPCGKLLEEGGCGHKCKGNCYLCFQGRIHKKCEENCGRVLACGHCCSFPCAALCPPCEAQCDFRCEHSKCTKICGVPCSGCNEPCDISCKHGKCNKLCREKCNRKPCDQPCDKKLEKCGHPCIGLCGEDCPPFCKICEKETVEEILFGDEDEPDAKFIYLKECKHIIEVNGMDKHMKVEIVENGVSVKKCPKCSTVIRTSRRYQSLLCQKMKDIVAIKQKIFGRDDRVKHELNAIVIELQRMPNSIHVPEFRNFLQDLTCTVSVKVKGKSKLIELKTKQLDQYMFETVANMMEWWCASRNIATDRNNRPNDRIDLTARYETLFANLMKRLLPLSQTEILDFDREFRRISDLHKVYRRGAIERFSNIPGASLKYKQLTDLLNVTQLIPYLTSLEDGVKELLKSLDDLIVLQVKNWKKEEEEDHKSRAGIFKAVGFSANHWYKCPNGHFYVIADCGNPNQRSHCPDCKSAIGGLGILTAGNSSGSDFAIYTTLPVRPTIDLSFINDEFSTTDTSFKRYVPHSRGKQERPHGVGSRYENGRGGKARGHR